jgi:hypothetical protein
MSARAIRGVANEQREIALKEVNRWKALQRIVRTFDLMDEAVDDTPPAPKNEPWDVRDARLKYEHQRELEEAALDRLLEDVSVRH